MRAESVERTLNRAAAMARGGGFLEAHRLYRHVLSRHPENRRAVAGLRALQTPAVAGRREWAKAAEAGLAAVLSLARAGRRAEALAACRTLATRHDDRVDVLLNLGALALGEGALEEAVGALVAALRLQPTLPGAHSNLGVALQRLGRPAEAELAFRNALALDARFVAAIVGLGLLALEAEDPAAAAAWFRGALAIEPDRHDALTGLGVALTASGECDAAVAALTAALRVHPGAPDTLAALGSALREAGRIEEALATYRAAIQAGAATAAVQNNLAALLVAVGRTDEAREAYSAAIALAPGNAALHRNRAAIVTFRPSSPELAELLAAVAAAGPDTRTMMHFAFAVGKARHDLGEVDAAFDAFALGNQLRKTLVPFDIASERAAFAAIMGSYDGAVAEARGDAGPVRPVFVVGMPRSGTTLVEEILGAHSAVAPLGETANLQRSLAAVGPLADTIADPGRLAAVRAEYLALVAPLAGPRRVVIEKLPANHRHVGLIAAAFPHAVLIDVRRRPEATCWSIFTQYFSARGNDWAYGLADIAHYFRLYDRLMAYWRKRLPGRVATVDYDALTADPEAGVRALLHACDLPFEDACLTPHSTTRAVRTASAAQVRRPIYAGSSEAWRRYEHRLGEMLAILAAPQDG